MAIKVFDPADPATWDDPRPPMTMSVEDPRPEGWTPSPGQIERYERNEAWFSPRLAEIHAQHQGTWICVAGQELFVADTMEEVTALAEAAYPEDDGRVVRLLCPARGRRFYGRLYGQYGLWKF
jgi:hypothetical protein